MILAAAIGLALAVLWVLACLLVRGAQDHPDCVSPDWITAHLRERRDDDG
jgi:hypothetical protein